MRELGPGSDSVAEGGSMRTRLRRFQAPASGRARRRNRRRRPRYKTQSDPPDDDGRQRNGCGEVGGQLVIAGSDAAEVLESTEHALDEIALPVGDRIEGVEAFPRRIVRDYRQSAALDQKLTQAIAVVGGIGGTQPSRRQRRQESRRRSDVSELPCRYFESDGASAAIDDGTDFGGASAPRPTNRLRRRPPFPPPAERRTLAVVLSIICTSSGVTTTSA